MQEGAAACRSPSDPSNAVSKRQLLAPGSQGGFLPAPLQHAREPFRQGNLAAKPAALGPGQPQHDRSQGMGHAALGALRVDGDAGVAKKVCLGPGK